MPSSKQIPYRTPAQRRSPPGVRRGLFLLHQVGVYLFLHGIGNLALEGHVDSLVHALGEELDDFAGALQSGAAIEIPASKAPVFKAGKAFKDAIK